MEDQPLLFPDEVFPERIRRIIHECHEAYNFPVNYVCGAILFASATIIGNAVQLCVKEGWTEKPILFMALVGGPGASKTQPIRFALRPLYEQDAETIQVYNEQVREYRRAASGDTDMEKPVAHQYIVKDITIEALAKVLSDNPNGVGVHNDELKGWFSSFNRYHKSGGDQEQWLSLYSGDPVVVNRKGTDEIISIRDPFVGVIGGIQPEILKRLFKGELMDNGFLYRILFLNNSSKDLSMLWDKKDFPCSRLWGEIARELIHWCHRPKKYWLSDDAWERVRSWQNLKESYLTLYRPEYSVGIFRKIQVYCLRFSIVIHSLREALGEVEPSGRIDLTSMEYAVKVANYFYQTALDVYDMICGESRVHESIQIFLDLLPPVFSTGEALQMGRDLKRSRSTVFNYLSQAQGKLIIKDNHGRYYKMDGDKS